MAIIFFSFYIFASQFLDIKERRTRIIGSLFFACNPIFLGYIAKIGLMVGAAMLPLCFVVLAQAFQKKQFRYFVLYVLLLNVSLIHPFTFTINLLVSGLYALTLLKKQGGFIWKHKTKTLGVLLLAFALNAYFILPVMSLGTVSKTAISEEISYTPVDYTSLVDFANTGNPFTALSLSRDVLLDFNYYNISYAPIYFGAVFLFYFILLGLYIYNERELSKADRSRVVLLFGIFLVLLLLSMALFFDINTLLKKLVGLPGGWMFRSPLKWQLYIPFVLATMFSMLLYKTESKRIRSAAALASAGMIVLMSVFLGVEIYRKLLVPRQFHYMAGLQQLDLEHKNLLFTSDNDCFAFLQSNPEVVTEMNQIFTSKNVQLKRIKTADLDTINLGSYDYILGCKASLTQPMSQETRFKNTHGFAENLQLYENKQPPSYIYASDKVYLLSKAQNLSDKYQFGTTRGQAFDFVTAKDAPMTTGLYDPFEALTLHDIHDDRISTELSLSENGTEQLNINRQDGPRFYQKEQTQINFSPRPTANFLPLAPDQKTLDLGQASTKQFAFLDTAQKRQNLIPNPSFEDGLWQKNVWDCYAYDKQPAVGMALNDKQAAAGKKSLELTAKRHIACTGQEKIPVIAKNRYLLHFRYRASLGSYGSYSITFDDQDTTTVSDYLPAEKGDWVELSKEIEVPQGSHNLRLILNAHPSNTAEGGKMLYDDFTLINIPDLQGRFFVTDEPQTKLQQPASVAYQDFNPTKKQVQIKGAKAGFYLAMRDTYHSRWQLMLQEKTGPLKPPGKVIGAENHVKLNGFMNGWYINPSELCARQNAACKQNSDGSYDINLSMTFAPQQWFYKGLIISAAAFAGVIGYFIYSTLDTFLRGRNRYWRWQ